MKVQVKCSGCSRKFVYTEAPEPGYPVIQRCHGCGAETVLENVLHARVVDGEGRTCFLVSEVLELVGERPAAFTKGTFEPAPERPRWAEDPLNKQDEMDFEEDD